MTSTSLLQIVGILLAAIALAVVVRWRRRDFSESSRKLALEVVCPHLRPALEALLKAGHVVHRVGQKAPDFPMEIHVQPGFEADELVRTLGLEAPVQSSDRKVLFCRDDWCEIHPSS
jgi:hypothetical protein